MKSLYPVDYLPAGYDLPERASGITKEIVVGEVRAGGVEVVDFEFELLVFFKVVLHQRFGQEVRVVGVGDGLCPVVFDPFVLAERFQERHDHRV